MLRRTVACVCHLYISKRSTREDSIGLLKQPEPNINVMGTSFLNPVVRIHYSSIPKIANYSK